MPKSKGRKKGRNRERRGRAGDATAAFDDDDNADDDASGAGPEARAVQQATVQAAQPMPSSMARATGVVLAAVTGIVGAYVLWDGISNSSSVDGVVRIVVGIVVLLLAVVIGVLSVAPEVVVSLARRLRS